MEKVTSDLWLKRIVKEIERHQMFDMTKSKLILILVILLVLVSLFARYMYKQYIDKSNLLDHSIALNTQNQAAYESAAKQKADSIQVLAVRVESLNGALTKAQREGGYWKAMATALHIKIDSLKIAGVGVGFSGEDSIGKYVRVDFSGKQNIFNYRGHTLYYFLSTPISYYLLDGNFDTFVISSHLYQDVDKIWRIYTKSLTPGIKFTESFVVDDAIYIGMRNAVEEQFARAKHYSPPFGLILRGGAGMQLGNLKENQLRYIKFDASVEGYYKHWSLVYSPLDRYISFGATYLVDVKEVLNVMF